MNFNLESSFGHPFRASFACVIITITLIAVLILNEQVLQYCLKLPSELGLKTKTKTKKT